MSSKPLGAHVPWAQVERHLDRVLSLELAPEIAFKGPDLDLLSDRLLGEVADQISITGLRPPFL